jgi:MerR family redox-sensitive transcriptional activator SoxR
VAKRFSIREIADRSGVSVSALRYYEDRGLLTSGRNAAGQRTYAVDALRRVAFITVGSSLGMSLADIEHALAGLPHNRVPTKRDWERVATAWRAELDRRLHAIEIMRERLTACIGCGCLSLRDCSLTNRRDRAAARGAGPRYLLGDAPDDPGDTPKRHTDGLHQPNPTAAT